MHDIAWIRNNPEAFDAALKRRGLGAMSEEVRRLDGLRKDAVTRLQETQTQLNEASKEIGKAINANDHERQKVVRASINLAKEGLPTLEARAAQADADLKGLLEQLPNLPNLSVPDGQDEHSNVLVRVGGTPRMDGPKVAHEALGEALGLMDFQAASDLSGSRFVVLRGALARLHRAIGQYMLDKNVRDHNYEEVDPPLIVREPALYGTGQLPKFADDLYSVGNGSYLIPTSEVTLTNLAANKIAPIGSLPQRYTALTQCFRSEAGSAGRDTRGMIRQHQFTKCELVSICEPDRSEVEHETMLAHAEAILTELGLPYRVMLLCAGDMGFSALKTYDLEVWLPSQGKYREISSVSNCGDFQARRMNAKFKDATGKNRFVHTLNGSALAVGRTLVAIMENFQNNDGSISVPEVLVPYMGGETVIGK